MRVSSTTRRRRRSVWVRLLSAIPDVEVVETAANLGFGPAANVGQNTATLTGGVTPNELEVERPLRGIPGKRVGRSQLTVQVTHGEVQQVFDVGSDAAEQADNTLDEQRWLDQTALEEVRQASSREGAHRSRGHCGGRSRLATAVDGIGRAAGRDGSLLQRDHARALEDSGSHGVRAGAGRGGIAKVRRARAKTTCSRRGFMTGASRPSKPRARRPGRPRRHGRS